MGTRKKLIYRSPLITHTTFEGIINDRTLNIPRISQSIRIINAQIIAVSLYVSHINEESVFELPSVN